MNHMMRIFPNNRFGGFVPLFALLLSGFIAGCDGGHESVAPPAGLSYSNSSVAYVTGAEIIPNTPSSSGGSITGHSVAPLLPAGLILNPQTGVISGTPTAVSAPAIYTVTGSNAAGSASARVQIEVRASAIAPESLSYRDNPVIYAVGEEIDPNMPNAVGGEITQYSVSPALPPGLDLNVQTGVISGTPMGVSAAAVYMITGSNSAGSVQEGLNIEVRENVVPPAGLTYSDPEPVYTVAQPIVPNMPQASGGEITEYSVSPQLPAGLSIDAQTGVISGTPAAIQNKAVYTVSGSNSAGSVAAPVAITVTSIGEWLPASSMNKGRWYHTATLLSNGRVLVVGGESADKKSTELYDPVANQWSPAESMTNGRWGHTATLLEKTTDKVLVAGGGVNLAELYDPATGRWSSAGNMAVGRDQGHTATELPDGNVLVAGGVVLPTGSTVTGSAELYDPRTSQWSPVGNMANARTWHKSTLLLDGKVLVTGGGGDHHSPISSAELYDPQTKQWSPAGQMAVARYVHTATLLPDGKVLVAGGRGTPSAELYDPVTNQWSSVASMAFKRDEHTATLLPDGRVLVAGGYPSGTRPLSSAEFFR